MQITASEQKTIVTPDRLAGIKLLLLDVDGVLTDGKVIYDDSGAEIKEFNVRDGLGIRLLIKAGIPVGIVTGRTSNALLHRCKDLGIELVYDGVQDKGEVLTDIIRKYSLSAEEIAFMGDDLPDLPPMRRVGVAFAPADAHPLVLNQAHRVTLTRGGNGAVREVCEAVLTAHGLWEKTLERF